MKTTVTIRGVGKRMSGISKTGRPYDFTPIAVTYYVPSFTGEKAATVNVDAVTLGDYVPYVGSEVEAFIHEDFRTGRVQILAIL